MNFWIYLLGLLGQSLFGARVLVQWWITEKRKRIASPLIFWILSLIGAVVFLIYGIIRNDIAIVIGQCIGYFVYIRNLQLIGYWSGIPLISRIVILLIPALSYVLIAGFSMPIPPVGGFIINAHPLALLGIVGQLLFNVRFLYQLYYAEKHHESILPMGFWLISLSGSTLTIIYAIFREDPVLLIAQSLALIPYVRNIAIRRRNIWGRSEEKHTYPKTDMKRHSHRTKGEEHHDEHQIKTIR
ncbi:MAG: lipid-A-disaccharide synthase N-terminal domain-containing protein [Chryseolinea sp.]